MKKPRSIVVQCKNHHWNVMLVKNNCNKYSEEMQEFICHKHHMDVLNKLKNLLLTWRFTEAVDFIESRLKLDKDNEM